MYDRVIVWSVSKTGWNQKGVIVIAGEGRRKLYVLPLITPD